MISQLSLENYHVYMKNLSCSGKEYFSDERDSMSETHHTLKLYYNPKNYCRNLFFVFQFPGFPEQERDTPPLPRILVILCLVNLRNKVLCVT